MVLQLPRQAVLRQLNRSNLESADPSLLHGGNAIRIATDQNDTLDGLHGGKIGYVEAYPHIDPLLLEVWLEVVICQLGLVQGDGLWLEPPELQHPTPNSNQVATLQVPQPGIIALDHPILAGYWQLHGSREGGAVVVERPQHNLVGMDAGMCCFLNEIRVVSEVRLLGQNPKVAPVDQNCYLQNGRTPQARPKGFCIKARLRA